MRVEVSGIVRHDLRSIADWIARDNPRRAVSFIRELRMQFRKIGQAPLLYQSRSELGEHGRMAVFGRYVILFKVLEDVVRIERVVHGSRDLAPLFPSGRDE